jgi:alpha-glucoside transport system substrate-binding protein
VKILGAFPDDQAELFQASVLPLEQRSGVDVIFLDSNEDYELDLENRLESGEIPDIVVIPQPGWLAKLAEQGKIVDLTKFMDKDYLRQQYPETYLELATEDGRILGIWHNIDVKSVVWYPIQAFEAKGYEVPETWDELIALSDQIVADGGAPWCIGIESAEFTGWVGTDWVEDILLRTAPPETYDAWVRHELPFDSPEIRRAFEILGGIWLNDAYIYGGTANIPVESIFDSPDHLFEQEPGCYLHKQASFAHRFFPPGVVHGQDYDFFYLPPIDPEFGKPVLGAGNLFAMVTDRPEVREAMRYLTTVEATRPFVENGGFLSPHKDTPLEWFPTPEELQFAQIILGADAYRFDASDMMPDQVGLRSFYRGIVDWVKGADLDTVLQEIDKSWPE